MAAPTKEEVYKAMHKVGGILFVCVDPPLAHSLHGTKSSKRNKQAS